MECKNCNGKGYVRHYGNNPRMDKYVDCPACSQNLKTKNNTRQQNVRKNALGETNQLDTDSSRIVTDGHIPADSISQILKKESLK